VPPASPPASGPSAPQDATAPLPSEAAAPPDADLDLRLVRYFTAVAEHRHFGRAAAELLVAQPSLSRQVRRLEQQLGARLLDRTPQGTSLTEAGEVFLPRARALLRAAAQAAAATKAAAQPSWVTIGYTPGLIITPAVRQMRRKHPDADVRTLHLEWNEARAALLGHRVDAVVTRLPLATDGLHVTVLYDEPRLLMVPVDHRLAGKESVTLDDIADEPIPRLPDPALTPSGASTRARTARRLRTAPGHGAGGQERADRLRAGRGDHPRRPARHHPAPRPDYDPVARGAAEPCDPGHEGRGPRAPRRCFPQVSARMPDRAGRGVTGVTRRAAPG
jgi:DNA-binding transcriptional LysR family regulator